MKKIILPLALMISFTSQVHAGKLADHALAESAKVFSEAKSIYRNKPSILEMIVAVEKLNENDHSRSETVDDAQDEAIAKQISERSRMACSTAEMMLQLSSSQPPEFIYVSGMPLLLRGWNGKYKLVNTEAGPEWHLVSRSYYGIAIIPTKIFKRNGKWRLTDVDEWNDAFSGPTGDSPVGEWGSFLVTTSKTWATWWRSNISD